MDIVGLLRDSEFSAANARFKAADEIERLREQNRLLAMDKIDLRGRLASFEQKPRDPK